MRILLINPNTSVDMTERIVAQAQLHVAPDTELVAVTAEFGCEVIASRASYAIAAHAALDVFAKHRSDVDAVVLACFGDPGLAALREIACVPVIGLLDSVLIEASRLERPFSIVTAGGIWVHMFEELVRLSAHAAMFRGVFALDTTGIKISRDPKSAIVDLQAAVDAATASGSKAVVLGGAALAGLGSRLNSSAELIDPLTAAMELAQRKDGKAHPHSGRPRIESCGLSSKLRQILADD